VCVDSNELGFKKEQIFVKMIDPYGPRVTVIFHIKRSIAGELEILNLIRFLN
jgi:hypothetical protein